MADDDVIFEMLLAAGRKKSPADALVFWETVEDRVRHWRRVSERDFEHVDELKKKRPVDNEAELEHST